MNRRELERSWAITRAHLSTAERLLPKDAVPGEGGCSLSRYREWLDHNELELALDELACVGDENTAPREFWRALMEAAQNMGLTDHAEAYAKSL